MNNLKGEAAENRRRLGENTYPGRGIVLGRSEDGSRLVQIYWIMGRSENSRNRIFVREGPRVRTEACDPARLGDPSLVIYTAMTEAGQDYLVTNGDQTDTLAETLQAGGTWQDALRTRAHEPDEPNWTPRISGGLRLGEGPLAWLSIVKADPFDPAHSLRFFFEYDRLEPGYGRCITTYRSDGTPLPPYSGEPMLVPLYGEVSNLAHDVWQRLNEQNRISLALKLIDPATGASETEVINKYSRP